MTELPGADAALAATPGAALATAREASGLSIAQVAEQMRISPRQVEAIEADRYGELPGTVFVRGFVRNYARLLKLDPVPLLHALEPALGGDVPLRAHEIAGTLPETTRRGHGRLWLGVIVVVVAAAAIAAAYEWWRGRVPAVGGSIGSVAPGETPSTPQLPGPEATAPAQATVPLSPERVTDSPAPPADEATQSNEAVDGVPSPAPAATPQSPGAMSQNSTATSQSPGATPQSPAARDASVGVRMQIAFVGESWIEIRDGDGMVQFSGTVPAGSTRSFEVQPPADVIVGNASGVRITYNGEPFDLAPHATRNIARFRLE
ncbi:MAG: DUF4115 domain-containing protein [Betaproteobacteria bacterium]|nr:DUF4115 domain-containing protein [Betaproteobacteria bacterium]